MAQFHLPFAAFQAVLRPAECNGLMKEDAGLRVFP